MPPKTLNDAVTTGLAVLTVNARMELAEVGYVDPHTKYKTDFESIVADVLGLSDESNKELLEDVALNHADKLHFLESDGRTAQPSAVLRVVLTEMAQRVDCFRQNNLSS